jgi:glyoxylase-like metal-dependent hydrolase (beta-lactamase superfamily II)
MGVYKIHPIVLGTKVFDKGMMTYQHGYGQTYVIPIYAWYLEGGDKTILVDTGEMSPIQSQDREKSIGAKIHTFEEGLHKWGLSPEGIDVVIHTHLHNDHCENDYKCTKATFFVHEKELERVHNPHPLDFRYLEDYIEDVEENGQIESIAGDADILPGIRVRHTPVHTEGGLSVEVDTDDGKAIISGFCVINDNFYPPKAIRAMEMEVIPPGTPVNVYQAYDITLDIKSAADVLIPLHEPCFAGVETVTENPASTALSPE